jgi:hypothetical protein
VATVAIIREEVAITAASDHCFRAVAVVRDLALGAVVIAAFAFDSPGIF